MPLEKFIDSKKGRDDLYLNFEYYASLMNKALNRVLGAAGFDINKLFAKQMSFKRFEFSEFCLNILFTLFCNIESIRENVRKHHF